MDLVIYVCSKMKDQLPIRRQLEICKFLLLKLKTMQKNNQIGYNVFANLFFFLFSLSKLKKKPKKRKKKIIKK